MNYDEWLKNKDPVLFDAWNIILDEKAKQSINYAFQMGWNEAMNSKGLPKNCYKLGETVEAHIDKNSNYYKGIVSVVWEEFFTTCITNDPENVRRELPWIPRDGQTILAKNKSGRAFYAVSAGGKKIYSPNGVIEAYDIKPFKSDCNDKLWSEI